MMRAVVSAPPPGGNPTIRRTGRDGYACALADPDTIGSAAAPAARCRNSRRRSFMAILLKMLAEHLARGPLMARPNRCSTDFQNSRLPTASSLPQEQRGLRHVPLAALRLDYITYMRRRKATCQVLAVRPEGAGYQWRKIPPGELSIDPVADERLM